MRTDEREIGEQILEFENCGGVVRPSFLGIVEDDSEIFNTRAEKRVDWKGPKNVVVPILADGYVAKVGEYRFRICTFEESPHL